MVRAPRAESSVCRKAAGVAAFCLVFVCACSAFDLFDWIDAHDTNDIAAVAAKKSADYVRVKRSDGSYAPESYAFGKGGLWEMGGDDPSIDKLTFLNVAHTIAYPLASRNYIPGFDPKTTKLLIMVYWGGTAIQEPANMSSAYATLQEANGSLSASMMTGAASALRGGAAMQVNAAENSLDSALALVVASNQQRNNSDYQNAMLLGYDSWWEKAGPQMNDIENPIKAHEFEDLQNEIEDGRYFVVLMAYDFQMMRTQKKRKLLWETRFSIRQRHHLFDRDLPRMAEDASKFFGEDSHGLVHEQIPQGRVDIGPLKNLGEPQELSAPASSDKH